MQDFHQLNVWRRAHALVLRIYKESSKLPASESFGLTSNLRRCAVGIPRAIAEGCGRATSHEFANDLRKARAVGHELEYLLLLCRDLGFFPEPLHDELRDELIEVGKMISGLLRQIAAPAEPVR